jgi:hypothetical protein
MGDRFDTMSVKQLRTHIAASGMSDSDCVEKSDLRARAREAAPARRGARGGKPTRQAQQPRTQPAEFGSSGGGGEAGLAPCGHWYAHGQSIHRCLWLQHHGTTLTDRIRCAFVCDHSGRTFAIDRIGKHMAICAAGQKHRRTFDSASKRTFTAGGSRSQQRPEASSLKPLERCQCDTVHGLLMLTDCLQRNRRPRGGLWELRRHVAARSRKRTRSWSGGCV